MQYEYDSTGDLFNLVVMTFLLLILAPVTYRSVRPRRSKNEATKAFPVQVQDDELRNELVRGRPASATSKSLVTSVLSVKTALLVGGWATVAYLAHKVINTKREQTFYDPYEILGIATSATEKEIKRHFKRLSIKFHPDKVRLTANQTMEMVEKQFVELTKAYKALTDEEIRQNYIEYGHPDGRQDLAVGIALPTWIVQGGSSLWVLGAYCVTLLIGLPLLVGRWWYKSSAVTKDGLLTGTAETYFKAIKARMTYDEIVRVLCDAQEYASLSTHDHETETELHDLAEKVKVARPTALSDNPSPASVLLHAHMCRITVPAKLIPSQTLVLDKILDLQKGLLQIVLAYGYLDTALKVMQVSPCLAQAVYWDEPAALQLPYATKEIGRAWNDVKIDAGIQDLLEVDDAERRELLAKSVSGGQLSDSQYANWLRVALGVPDLEIGKAHFKVDGDAGVTPNALVQLVVMLRRASDKPLEDKELAEFSADEADVTAVAKQEELFSGSAVRDTLAWAPYLPTPPKNHFWLSMVDAKQDRVIIGPVIVEDVGEKVRTYKLQFQAPPGVGVYTFQLHLISDTYRGLNKQLMLVLEVQDETEVLKSSGRVREEDEISEPDEDSLAGQMAQLKGQPVKRHDHLNGSDGPREHEYSSSDDDDDDDDTDDSDSDTSSDSDDD
ncbi:secretory subunit [Savitreella phatthalungensis]